MKLWRLGMEMMHTSNIEEDIVLGYIFLFPMEQVDGKMFQNKIKPMCGALGKWKLQELISFEFSLFREIARN
jgi:hypothetical protein